MAKHSLEDFYISVDSTNVEKHDKSVSVIQAMNYALYGITEKMILSNECEIICSFIKELSKVLTGEERQILKKYLHLYGNTKISWRATKRLRIWSIIDTTVRAFVTAIESKANKDHADYAHLVQLKGMINNQFISSCNLIEMTNKLKFCSRLILENEDGDIMKRKVSTLEDILRVNINADLDYFSCADIIGISLDYSGGDAKLLKLVETLLTKIPRLNSLDLATEFASEMTACGDGNEVRHKRKKGLST